jgi:hypothetical protein
MCLFRKPHDRSPLSNRYAVERRLGARTTPRTRSLGSDSNDAFGVTSNDAFEEVDVILEYGRRTFVPSLADAGRRTFRHLKL